MPLLEYRALLLEAPAEEEEALASAPGDGQAVLPRPAPLPAAFVLIGGAQLRLGGGGEIRIRRAPDIYELVLEDII